MVESNTVRSMKSYETVSDHFGGALQGVVWNVRGQSWWLWPQSHIKPDAYVFGPTDCIWMVPQWPGRG